MSRHTSVWIATGATHPFEPLTVDVDVDVAVVGGGITGLTTALYLQRQGRRVAVLEGREIGAGTTGHTTGKVTSQHGLIYAELIERLGEDRARCYAEANQAAVGMVADLVAELGADCEFQRAPAYVYTLDPERLPAVGAEVDAAKWLGLPASFTSETDLPFPVQGAVRFDDQAHFHAHRYCVALADAVVAGGGRVFEHSRAVKVDEDQDGDERRAAVRTAGGATVTAEQVVVATLLPFVNEGGFFAKARPSRSYGVAATIRGAPPTGMYISAESPTRSVRPWRDGVVVVGESHETGHEEETVRFWGELERWTREVFDVGSFEYRWSAQDFLTADGVPYVGRSPRMERTWVATGFRKWGLTNGTAAAFLLSELIVGREHPWAEVFDAGRVAEGPHGVKKLVTDNLHVAKRLVQDRIARLRADSVSHLGPGEGGMVEVDGDAVGAYRDPEGRIHAVGITCTHMGCTLKWNSGERSWDCPCHGSRFSCEGRVLDGPAVDDLPVYAVDETADEYQEVRR